MDNGCLLFFYIHAQSRIVLDIYLIDALSVITYFQSRPLFQIDC